MCEGRWQGAAACVCKQSDEWVACAGILVYPRLINIGPQVVVGYPATPPPAKKAATKGAAATAAASGAFRG